MNRALLYGLGAVLLLHGAVHGLGAAAYLRLAEITGLPYKTTLLAGAWEVGPGGIRLFGVLWALAALGFVAAAAAWTAGAPGWQPLLLGVTFASLALTLLDFDVAFAGVVVNLALLAFLAFGARMIPATPT
jgi:hypothetical protein